LHIKVKESGWYDRDGLLHELEPKQKELRLNISVEHFETCKNNPNILERTIATDETWLKAVLIDAKSSRQCILPSQTP